MGYSVGRPSIGLSGLGSSVLRNITQMNPFRLHIFALICTYYCDLQIIECLLLYVCASDYAIMTDHDYVRQLTL